ncbi:MAG: carbohydrate-binding domain-containing protein [Oscillospiraceae bacterium]|nr:carbohydrate-binding domain-containing protein [Oscillospiraceae bacterium]
MRKRNRFSRSIAAAAAAATMCAALPAVDGFAAQTLAGDVDKDGKVGVTDLVLLQKYVLGTAKLDATAFDNADVYADSAVDVFDLAILKKMLLAENPVANTVYIHLKGNSITVEGDSNKVVQISGTTAKITASGIYYVDGSVTDGQIYVETAAEDTADVEIVLQGASFTNSTKSAIYTAAGTGNDKTKITLEGENTMTDTSQTAYTEAGVIFSNSKLSFTRNSTGSLTISSYMNAAINGEKKINLNGGTINIDTDTAPEGSTIVPDADGIKSDKNIEIEGAVLNIDTSGDGIKSDAGVTVLDGDIQIKAGNDAMQAATNIDISGGNVVASGDRGFRLTGDTAAGTAGKLNITGGTVMATATDYQVNGNETVDLSGSTQTIMLFDMAAEWKKASTITIGTKEFASNKKYDYVLVSDPSLSASQTYKVYIGGQQAKHAGDANGSFKNTGTATQYKTVELLTGGETVASGDNVVSSIVYNSSSVALYDASGAPVDASAASNVKVSNNTYVTITRSGAYTVSGKSTAGQLKVSTDDTTEPAALVELSFEGLELSNSSVAPVYVENVGDEVSISAKNGTTNKISDGTSHTDTYTNSDGETKTCAAAIYARDDLKLKGKGTLIVEGNTEDGIVSTNDIKLWNGTVQVTAADDGIRADSVKIGDTTDATNYETLNVTVTSKAGDGVKASSTETGKGFVLMSGGTLTVKSYADGIQAEQDFTMNGGTLDIYTYQGSGYTASGSTGSTGGWGGGMGMDGNANKTDISAKGIKAVGLYDASGTTYQSAGTITFNGGTIKVDSSDDSIHCAGDMAVNGGVFTLASADDGIHSDKSVAIGKTAANTFDDVQIYISKCYEGVEAPAINQNSGTVYVISTDDGYNAGGGADGSGSMNPGGPGSGWGQGSTTTSSNIVLNLNGGLVVLNSANGDHDSFDSNGNINVNGGYYCANGQEPMDCGDNGNSISMNGGSVISMTAGNTNLTTKYTFTDSNGNAIVSFVSGSGGGIRSGSTASGKSGATISGGTAVLAQAGDKSVTVGGTASGGSALGQASSSGGPGQRW